MFLTLAIQKDFFTCFRVVGLSNLRAHKFKQLFSHTYLICICGFDIKTLNHFFLHCPSFTNERQNLLLKVERIIPNIYRKSDTIITSMRLSGDQSFSSELNSDILHFIHTKVWICSIYKDLVLHYFCFPAKLISFPCLFYPYFIFFVTF